MRITGRRWTDQPTSALRRGSALLAAATILATALAAPAPAGAAESAAPLVVTRLEAESYSAQRGTRISPGPPPGTTPVVAGLSDGDRLRYDGVRLERARFTLVCFISPEASGTIVATLEVRLGRPWGTPQQSIPIRANLGGSIKQWAFGVPIPDGVHRLYLTVRQPPGRAPFAVDYLVFSEVPPPPSLNC